MKHNALILKNQHQQIDSLVKTRTNRNKQKEIEVELDRLLGDYLKLENSYGTFTEESGESDSKIVSKINDIREELKDLKAQIDAFPDPDTGIEDLANKGVTVNRTR